MTARALYSGGSNYVVDDPAVSLGDYLKSRCQETDIICQCIAINTMNETVVTENSSSGNPTEVALLHVVQDLDISYEEIRNTTKGRSDKGALGEFLAQGHHYEFSSARKMMSWAVPRVDGGYRLYCKGASEVVLGRCDKFVVGTQCQELSENDAALAQEVAAAYARRGMRCLALAYRDLPEGSDLQAKSSTVMNSDGSPAFLSELSMNLIALVGIEDPLRKEVPGAIAKCYRAGIDVRLVTGDSANTAVSIAYQAGILRDFHFREGTSERVKDNLKDNVLLEGKEFRDKVYRVKDDGTKAFDQAAFDTVWPYLRVLARSSPDDKLTLAHGLNQSNLFADIEQCKRLERDHGIKVFPDRQVVAMTGDGTNDAPALKRADIGFAMGIAGTQIAKDAADIILLDDNFASIVTAAKWGRNIFASIQKFLQFQLTVNICAVVTALVGAFKYQESPLAAIQLLWVNLLMDSLASLALASEPPIDELLERPPVNRTDSMITKRMLVNMVGQAMYQITVIMTLLFKGPDFFGFEHGHEVRKNAETTAEKNSEHYTFIFNAFVWMQLFNEINYRVLKDEGKCRFEYLNSPLTVCIAVNVFKGIQNNPMFIGIVATTAFFQVLIVQFGSIAFKVKDGGLSARLWGFSIMFGAISLLVKQIINVVVRIFLHCNGGAKKGTADRRKKVEESNADDALRS
jgi:P-type Ca2+ transporter type 2B